MASNPSPVNVTISSSTSVSCNPDPVVVTKGTNDGVRWTTANADWVFTGVKIDGVTITTTTSNGDFSGLTIDNTGANNRQSVMTVDDSLAEINGNVHQDDHAYSVLYQARSGGETYSFDPTIRNQN
jgi:hypothetical protein